MKNEPFETKLTVPCFGTMEAVVRLAAQDHMMTIAEYIRRAISDRQAKDGYLPRH